MIAHSMRRATSEVPHRRALAAFLPRDGECLRDLGRWDTSPSLIRANTVLSEDRTLTTIRPEACQEIFYGDCSDEDSTRAIARLVPQTAALGSEAVHTTDAKFGRIPRVYIECLQDRANPLAQQRRMYTAVPCERVISMDTSHSPFFSAPEELVAQLTSLERLPRLAHD